MATLIKDGKIVSLPRGVYLGRVVDFRSKGLKKTKNGEIFENGYLDIVLNNGVSLTQYIMIMPYNKSLFFKLVNALGLSHRIDEYKDFYFTEMFEKEVLIELQYESVRGGKYLNVINVYSLEEAGELLEYQNTRYELNRGNNEKSEIVENEIGFGDEYDKFIGD